MKTFYRVCNPETRQGLWYDFDGQFTGLIHNEFSFCVNSELAMDFDDELIGWLSAADSLTTLDRWFTLEDILTLQKKGWYVYEFQAHTYRMYDRFDHPVICKKTSRITKKIMKLKTVEDIPSDWKVIKAQKKTSVRIRPGVGVERFKVSWAEYDLISDPELDWIVISNDGTEYPCKKDIFAETYEANVLEDEQGNIDVTYRKKAVNTLVEVPTGVTVSVITLEGEVGDVQYPDYVVIGPRGELYVNTKKTVDEHMVIL